jgi:hypothetical protein
LAGVADARPPLSVVIPAREGLDEIEVVLEALLPEAVALGVEVVVVGGVAPDERSPSPAVRLVPAPIADMLDLHKRGIAEARGDVVAIGEDHALPETDWCRAVIRAHAERREAAAVAGCLVNATSATLAGRANFLAFAAPWQPPMAELPSERPPPASALSFKRSALEEIASRPPGWLEAEVIPSLFAQGSIAADDRVVVHHHQDHGSLWSICNAFHSARSSYGSKRERLAPAERCELARWTISNVPRRLRAEARDGSGPARAGIVESTLIRAIAFAAGIGAAIGVLAGSGKSPELVA